MNDRPIPGGKTRGDGTVMHDLRRHIVAVGCGAILILTACGGGSEDTTSVNAAQPSPPSGAQAVPPRAVAGQPQGLTAGGTREQPSVSHSVEPRPRDPLSTVTPPWRVAAEVARSNPDIGARMDPPAPGTVPRVGAAAAYKKFVELGIRPGGRATGHPDDVVLVLYSNDTYGDIQPDGTVKPRFQNVLAWAVIFRNISPPMRGAARGPDGSRPQIDPASYYCESVTFLDATIGEYMNGYDECVPR